MSGYLPSAAGTVEPEPELIAGGNVLLCLFDIQGCGAVAGCCKNNPPRRNRIESKNITENQTGNTQQTKSRNLILILFPMWFSFPLV